MGIMENDEPADVIYTWAKNMDYQKYEKTVIDLACPRLNCSDKKPYCINETLNTIKRVEALF